jgi:hypothetical protein
MPNEPAQTGVLATVSQPTFPIPADAVTTATNGGVAIATIFAVAYLFDRMAKLAEVLRKSDDD